MFTICHPLSASNLELSRFLCKVRVVVAAAAFQQLALVCRLCVYTVKEEKVPNLRRVLCNLRRVLSLEGWFWRMFLRHQNPESLERHLDAARQKLPRDNFCRSIAAQLPSPRGQF